MIFSKELSSRRLQSEVMDDPNLAADLHRQALQGLARIHRATGTAKRLWKTITSQTETRPAPDSPLKILDVACGGGDVAIGLAKLAQDAAWPVLIQGCDISERAIRFAEAQNQTANSNVSFFVGDALDPAAFADADVVYCSLFLHHLPKADVVRVLSRMKSSARRLVLVHDLLRSRLGYFYVWWGVRLFTRSPVCRVDGPLSVRSAWTAAELKALAEEAGLLNAKLVPHWPEQGILTWRRDEQS